MQVSQGLNVNLGVNPQVNQNPVVVAQNSDAQFLLSFFDEQGYPLDVTAATIMAFEVLEEDGVTTLSKNLESGITLVSGYPNQVIVAFAAADFALLNQGDNDAAVALTLASGLNYVFNLYSCLSIQPPVV